MEEESQRPDPEEAMERAVAALRDGALVVFPTETVYGIGCDALDPQAVARLCAAKQRPSEKGLATILGDASMMTRIATDIPPRATILAQAFWPGPLTLLLPARPDLPGPMVRDGKVACRVSSDPFATTLAAHLGRPIACPSANPADLVPAQNTAKARDYFGDVVAAYLDGGPRSGQPSTLADPGPPLRILREGPVTKAALEAALK